MSEQTGTRAQDAATSDATESLGELDEKEFQLLPWMADRGIVLFTVVLILFAAVFVDGFASLANITDVFNRAAPIGIVAVAMTFVVISANYLDLSVVAMVATAAVTLIAVSNSSGSIVLAMLITLGIALVYGLVNGIAVGVFKANAVIVTLSTTFIGLGILRWASGGSIYFGPQDGAIRSFGLAKLGPFPLSMLVLIVITLILSYVLTRTTFGFLVKSYGSNRAATRLAGVNTAWVVIGAFMISAIGAMIGGFVLAAFSNTAVSTNGDRLRLPGAGRDRDRRDQRLRRQGQRAAHPARRRLRQCPDEPDGPVGPRLRPAADGDRRADRRRRLPGRPRAKGGYGMSEQQQQETAPGLDLLSSEGLSNVAQGAGTTHRGPRRGTARHRLGRDALHGADRLHLLRGDPRAVWR